MMSDWAKGKTSGGTNTAERVISADAEGTWKLEEPLQCSLQQQAVCRKAAQHVGPVQEGTSAQK